MSLISNITKLIAGLIVAFEPNAFDDFFWIFSALHFFGFDK